MHSDDQILAAAIEATDEADYDLDGLTQYCLDHSPLLELSLEAGERVEDYFDDIIWRSAMFRVDDREQVIRVDRLLDGVVFTHRMSGIDDELGGIPISPDLAGIFMDGASLTLPEGEPIEALPLFEDGLDALSVGIVEGPDGWLDAYEAGTLVAFRRAGTTVHVEPVTEPDAGGEAALLRAMFDEVSTGEMREPFRDVLLDAMIEDRSLFRRPSPPMADILVEAKLEVVEGFVAELGSADARFAEEMSAARDRLVHEYRMEPCCTAAFDRVRAAFDSDDYSDMDHRGVARDLDHGPSANALVSWVQRADLLHDMSSIEVFASSLIDRVRHSAAAAHYLRALALEEMSDALAAEADLEAALRADPDYPPALAKLATYASDRGDARRAVSLLRRAGVGDDAPMLTFLVSLSGGYAGVGRNDRCPCGSGRKYKVCHLNQPGVEPGQNMSWLMSKLGDYADGERFRSRTIGLASSAVHATFEIEDLVRRVADPFIQELAIFDGGIIEEFIYDRGVLLPAEERDILDLWAMAELALWDIVETDGIDTTVMRDTKTGDEVTVTDRAAATSFGPGDLALARPLPGWGKMWMSAVAIPVDLRWRDSALALLDSRPGPDEIAMWYGSLQAPPTLRTRENEDMVQCRATLAPTESWDVLIDRLDTLYEPDEDDDTLWRELHPLSDDEMILRATLRHEDDELVVATHSVERMDRVVGALAGVAEVIDRVEHPAGSPQAFVESIEELGVVAPGEDGFAEDLPDEFMAGLAQRLEDQWLSESVPALGGLTPFEAAADPTRRDDLIRLLNSFDATTSKGILTMNIDNVRRRLGLAD